MSVPISHHKRGNVEMHNQSVHKGVAYKCDDCPIRQYRKKILKNILLVSIKGISHISDQHSFQATRKGNLDRHILSIQHQAKIVLKNTLNVLKGVIFNCDKCSYQATTKKTPKAHTFSVHIGVKYNFEECVYQEDLQLHLKVHRTEKQ